MEDMLLHASFTLILTVIVLTGAGLLLVKLRMGKNEKVLRNQLISPCGAGVSHGMIRRSGGRGVEHDSQPSLSWYSRLFDSPF